MQNMLKRGRRRKTRTSELYDIAANSVTEIICCDLPETHSVSVRTSSGSCYIGIDPFEIETEAEERVHLAHEIGHCETGSFYNAYSDLDVRGKHERRADCWAAARLVPASDLICALKCGVTELWALAEIFNITEDFMKKVIDIYSAKGILPPRPVS